MNKKQRANLRCATCGQFVGWDGYYARWHCHRCERTVTRAELDRLMPKAKR